MPWPERFWAKVEKTDTCWIWIAALGGGHGYGMIRSPEGRKMLLAHRVAYELLVGPIPPGLELDHLCRNRRCVNPEHLEPVTHRENILRGDSPPAHQVKITHCPRGHEYTAGNTYWQGRKRSCLRCRRDRARRQSRRKATA